MLDSVTVLSQRVTKAAERKRDRAKKQAAERKRVRTNAWKRSPKGRAAAKKYRDRTKNARKVVRQRWLESDVGRAWIAAYTPRRKKLIAISNEAVGKLQDDPALCRKAAEYLESCK